MAFDEQKGSGGADIDGAGPDHPNKPREGTAGTKGRFAALDTLRAKLIALFLLFGLAPAVGVFAIFMFEQSEFERAFDKPLVGLATQITDVVDRNLFERYGDVQAFGINAAAQDSANWRRPSADNPLVAAMNGYTTGYGIYKLMVLVGLDGSVLAVNSVDAGGNPLATDRLYERSFADAPWFRKAMAGEFLKGRDGLTGTVVEQPAVDDTVAEIYGDDGYVIPFAAPVKDAAGETIAVWANFATFDLVEEIVGGFYDQLAEDGMTEAELTVLDPQGRVIVDFDPTVSGSRDYRRNFDVIGKLDLAGKGVASAVAAVKGETGSMISVHARKRIEQAAGYAHSRGAYGYPGLDWSALVRVPVEQAYGALTRVITIMLVVMAAAGAVIAALGTLTGTLFSRPITRMTAAMNHLADGDTSIDVPARDRGDEIGKMAGAVQVFKENAIRMEQMAAEQQEIERRAEEEKRRAMNELADNFEASVKGVVETVTSAATEMESSAKALTATAEETNQQAGAVAAASEQATANVQTVAAASEELSSSIAEIGRQVAQAAGTSQQAKTEAERTNAQVQGLAEAAQKITDIVDLINDIAGQTNLLALNATIEAARAGDAGKGFAVVASEVKNLATQTAKATEEIGAQIGSVQSATEKSVAVIQGITKTIGDISEISTAIASAVEQQDAATSEISRNVQEAAQGTQDVSSNIGGVTQAASETGASASQMLTAAGQLSREAESLRGEVDKFLAQVRAA